MKKSTFLLKSIFIVLAIFLSLYPLMAQTASDVYYGENDKQVLDFWKATQKGSPILIFIHGGDYTADKAGWNLEQGPNYFVQRGYATVNINYRHEYSDYPESSVWPVKLRDLACAVSFVKRNADLMNGDSSTVILIGYSAGGFLANMHGHTYNNPLLAEGCIHKTDLSVKAVVALASWKIGMEKVPLPEDKEIGFGNFNVINFVNNKTKPAFLILHGTNDQKVGSVDQFAYYRELRLNNYPVQMQILDGKGHNILYNQAGICERIESFLDDFLSNKPLNQRSFVEDVSLKVDQDKNLIKITLSEKLGEDITLRVFNKNKLQIGENIVFHGSDKQIELSIPKQFKFPQEYFVNVFSPSICQTIHVNNNQ
jgi:pimeloyl-ACP methyl ester carboxylesterase